MQWPENFTVQDAATYLLGPIFGFLLRLRGVVSLHASGVMIGDHAVALVGPAGAGKSTTAAAFAQCGYPVITDDVFALKDSGGRFFVEPGYATLRLWPDSVEALCGSPHALPLITPNWDKRYLDLRSADFQFANSRVPISAIYVLGERRQDAGAPDIGPEPDAFVVVRCGRFGWHGTTGVDHGWVSRLSALGQDEPAPALAKKSAAVKNGSKPWFAWPEITRQGLTKSKLFAVPAMLAPWCCQAASAPGSPSVDWTVYSQRKIRRSIG